MTLPQVSRRDWLKLSAAGVLGYPLSAWLQPLARAAAAHPARKRSCILLWMDGGPTQTDTFDLKAGSTGSQVKPIATRVPGIQISENLPRIARFMDRMAIIRSMDTRADDHPPGAYLLHTGYPQSGPIQHPTLGSIVAREIGPPEAALPNFVSIAPERAVSPSAYEAGFLGPRYAPLLVGEDHQRTSSNYENALRVPDLTPWAGVSGQRFGARVDLLEDLGRDFSQQRPGVAAQSHQMAYQRAVALMRPAAQRAFNLETEASRVRDAYGRNLFGQGCLLARRLVERGVPFVEVTLSYQPGHANWDTHENNLATVRRLSEVLDNAWAALMEDLSARGLLDTTLIVWAGEFGRTPHLPRGRDGRDHWTAGWSTVLAGGGIRGGQVIGRTSADGRRIEERPVTPAVFLATVTKALGIDPAKMIVSNTGRPIPIAEDSARPIAELLG